MRAFFVLAFAVAACGRAPDPAVEEPGDPVVPLLDDAADARVAFRNARGEPIGFAEAADGPNGVLIRFDLFDLPTGWHGAHLHAVGDCSDGPDGFAASGAHIDPTDKAHGFLNPDGPEAADLANIYAHGNGRAAAEAFAAGLDLKTHLADADGAAIIIHAEADDHETQPIGGSGARIACGVVEVLE